MEEVLMLIHSDLTDIANCLCLMFIYSVIMGIIILIGRPWKDQKDEFRIIWIISRHDCGGNCRNDCNSYNWLEDWLFREKEIMDAEEIVKNLGKDELLKNEKEWQRIFAEIVNKQETREVAPCRTDN